MTYPIRIFDGNTSSETYLSLLAEIDEYQALSFGVSWYGVGAFSIKINKNVTVNNGVSVETYLVAGNIVMLGNSSRNTGIINEIVKTFSQDGKQSEIIECKGEELKTLFGRRAVLPPTAQARYTMTAQPAETVIKTVVKDQCGSTADANRQFSALQIDTDIGAGSSYTYSERYSNLLDTLCACGLATGLGFWVEFNASTKKFILYTGSGTDRTAGQSTNPRAIFSNQWNTAKSGQYQYTETAYKNLLYVGGTGVGTGRTIRTVYDTTEPTDTTRRESFIDARDLDTTAKLDAKGAQELVNLGFKEYLDVISLTVSPVVYGTGYNLGDMCTVSAFGGSYDTRIIQAVYVIEPQRYEIELTFDKRAPTLPSQIALGKRADAYAAGSIEPPSYTNRTSWTPTIIGSTTPGTQTYTVQQGYYEVVGKILMAYGYVAISAKDAAIAGNARIGGLPIVSTTATNYRSAVSFGQISGITLSSGNTIIMGRLAPGVSYIDIFETGSGLTTSAVTVSNVANTTVFQFCINYIID